MYNRTLKVALFGLPSEAEQAIVSTAPPARFAFEFAAAPIVDLEVARASSVVIADAEALGNVSLQDLSAAVHRHDYGFHMLAVSIGDGACAQWTKTDYALLDAVLPAPLTAARACFEFEAMVRMAKLDADRYMASAYLDTLIDSMPEMVWFKALDGEHVKVNSYFCDIVDKTREDVTGQFHNYIWSVPREDWEKAELTCKESDNQAIEAGTTCRCDENVSTHGEIRLFDTYKTPIYDEDGSVLGTTGFAHDVTNERELARQAWLNARIDYLTELYNRRYFYEYLEEHADDGSVTFVLIDLDNFKGINDSNGHGEGDNALLVTTRALRQCFPECLIVRWGGDEFIVAVPNGRSDLAGNDNVTLFQETLRSLTAAECPFALTASIGITEQRDGETVDAAVNRADDALYEAKAAGKARLARR